MRIAIGIGALFALFGLAALWQHWIEGQLAREQALAVAAAGRVAAVDDPDPWSTVLVGRASGADPLEPAVERSARPAAAPAGVAVQSAPATAPAPATLGYPADFVLRVQDGQRLWTVCEAHYGRATPALVELVARYNRLASPDRLRVGQTLHLPAREKLDALAAHGRR